MGKRGKRRTWSDDEKRSICQQTAAPGISVAQVARRYAMNANMIFKWLKDPRFAPLPEDCADKVPVDGFLPIEIDDGLPCLGVPEEAVPVGVSSSTVSASRVDITLTDGRRILIEGPTSLSAVMGLVQGLMP